MRLARSFLLVCGLISGLATVRADAAEPDPFSLPTFAWPDLGSTTAPRVWDGSFARVSSGFEVSSSRHFGGYAGPTFGFEGGRMWREGDLVYGIVGGFDLVQPITGVGTPRFGGISYSRDGAAALQLKAGKLLTEDVLLYAKVGGALTGDRWRFGPTPVSPPFSRSDVALRPDGRVGVEWAVTDRLTLGVEAGVTGSRIR